MPRNGSDIYSIPPGTEGFPDTTIESEKYNNYIHDVETDLNRPRPISAGGTGADDADEALANLGAEKSSQRVDNYDSHVWLPGSFYSLVGATGAPPLPAGQVATHKFVGWIVSSDIPATPPANQNVVVHARDQNDITVPGRIYVREKKANVWGPWSIDGTGVIGPTPPVDPPDGLLWWDNISGQLFVWYRDIDTAQWVIASPVPDPAQFLRKTGDTMIGTLGLAVPPVAVLDAANKGYVDGKTQTAADAANSAITIANNATTIANSKTAKSGDTMSGTLTISTAIPSDSALVLNKTSSGSSNDIIGQKNSQFRWAVLVGDYALETGGNNGSDFSIQSYSDSGAYLTRPFQIIRSSGNTIIIGQAYKPGGGLWADSSDARIKTVEKDYTAGLNEIVQLRPVVYTYKGNDTSEPPTGGSAPYQNSSHYSAVNKKFTGLVAQEVEGVFPEMVSRRSAYIDGTVVTDMRDLDTTSLVFALINSIKELKARIEMLEEA